MAKKVWIEKLYPRDEKALKSISNCGHVREEDLKTVIADKRIRNYIKDNIVEKETFNKNNGEQITTYKLTEKGRKLVEREYGVKEHQHAQSVNHDSAISAKYYSLTQEERDTWKTETTMQREFKEECERIREEDPDKYEKIMHQLEDKEISPVDAVYTSTTGEIIGYEVVTNNYGQSEIEAKIEFTEIMELTYEQRRV